MKLKTLLFGKTYAFRDVKDVLAKANEPKSGDRLAGLAAESAQERVAAKAVTCARTPPCPMSRTRSRASFRTT